MSLNPIQFGKDVLDQYGRYLLTTFRLSDPRLAEQLTTGLSYGPGSSDRLAKGPYVYLNRPFVQGPSFQDLLAEKGLSLHPGLNGLFNFKALYKHQEKALRAAAAGRHVLIATGTGSGKTEGFLLPILDHCLKLRDQDAEPGVVAVLIYPMNALVNDQLERLRRLLAGSRIPFARYTGETPDVETNPKRLTEPRAYTRAEIERAERLHTELDLPWEERVSRREILERPPRILLTNYAQLEYLLLRDKDLGLFRGAPLRFFVLDEIHSYTGALGSQVACLLRRLRSVARKGPDEILCIGSSATVTERESTGGEGQLRNFGSRLFGVQASSIEIVLEEYQRLRPAAGDRYVPPVPDRPEALLGKILGGVRDLLVADEVHALPEEVLHLAEELCGRPAPPGRSSLDRLWELLAPNRLVETLQEVFTRPVTLDDVLPRIRPLGGRQERSVVDLQAEILAYLTLGALARRDDEPLLRPKLHFFVQGLSGLWLRWHGPGKEPVAQLLYSERSPGDEHAWPLSFCRSCGQPFIHLHPAPAEAVDDGTKVNGFQRLAGTGPLPPEGVDADEKGLLLTDRLITGDEEAGRPGEIRYLCRYCGGLHEQHSGNCLGPKCARPGPLVEVQTWKQPISACPACGARSSERSPIVTLVRSTEVNDVMILAQTMLSGMPEPDLRKVLIFADSRQDAAFQAGWMEGRSFRFRLRHMAYRVLAQNPGRPWYFENLIGEVANLATSEGLIPSKGQAREPAIQRLRWLLIEELFAGSERQRRNSLEQLGLARVDYEGLGLDEIGPLAESWAREFKVPPQAATDTVQSLLDLFRLKHAVSHPLLGRFWTDRDREIREGTVTVQEHFRPHLIVQRLGEKKQRAYTIGLHSKNRSTAAERLIAAAFPECRGEQIDAFLDAAFEWLVAKEHLVPRRIKILSQGKVQDLAGISEGYQVNVDHIQIQHTETRFVCRHCGKAAGRSLPSGRCRSYRCEGRVSLEARDGQHFDVVQYTQREFVPLLSREHSAQVPKEDRLEAEREFKKTGGRANCLVATPTLELGVDIGPLEMVLLRNVPPSPANYAQRAGRAGRRHRIGAIFSYCRNVQHDQYFYGQPPSMISGEVRVPGFSMRNEPLVRQHVFSAILTGLRGLPGADEILTQTFPTYLWHYFGTKGTDEDPKTRRYRSGPPDLGGFRALLAQHEADLHTALVSTFQAQWPEDDAWVVSGEALHQMIREMPGELERVIATLWAEVRNYQRILGELRKRQDEGEQLAYEDVSRRNNYEAALNRLWADAQDNYSISYLARRGFFPGYALIRDHVRAQSVDPPIDLSRPVVVALRELAPASLIYANRRQYRMSALEIYRLKAQDPHFRPESLEQVMVLDPKLQRVVRPDQATEGGEQPGISFSSIQMIDVELEGLGRISDQEEYRHRRAYWQYALQLPEHRGGHRGRVGLVPYQFFREGNLRNVNLGAKKPGPAAPRPEACGFPICLVCGEVRSPLASVAEIQNFAEHHQKRCGKTAGWHALHVDVRSDLLVLGPFSHASGAANAIEALRIGCRRILEMGETELETELLTDEHGKALGVLFDPLPGGSGFLPLTMEHWERIVDAAREVLAACRCEKACYRCLLHFRNQQHHTILDRHVALDALSELDGWFERAHDLAPNFVQEKDHAGATESPKEDRFLAILRESRFPLPPEAQLRLELGGGSWTVADFAWPEQRVLVYVDGLSQRIHGNPEQQRKDRILRAKAEARGWKVRVISGEGLGDRTMVGEFLEELAVLLGVEG